MPDPRPHTPPAPLVALVGWLVPGGGYWLLGDRPRALAVGITILLLYLLGLLIGGIRVIDVPGYNAYGQRVLYKPVRDRDRTVLVRPSEDEYDPTPDPNRPSALRVQPFAEIINKPWFVAQSLVGPANILAARVSLSVSEPATPTAADSRVPPSHGRIFDIGTLYTAIAGMLALLAVIDSTGRAAEGGAR